MPTSRPQEFVEMPALDEQVGTVLPDRDRGGLSFVSGLLSGNRHNGLSLEQVIARLARAWETDGAGLFGPLGAEEQVAYRVQGNGQPLPRLRWPWDARPELLDRVRGCATALPLAEAPAGSWLLTTFHTPDNARWLLWLERSSGPTWSDHESVTLALAGQALTRWLPGEPGRPLWARQLERAGSRHCWEEIALAVRRLAHDYGNVLTSILGFTELTLSRLAGESPIHRYVQETHKAAQQGAELTYLLQMSGCRRATQVRPCSVAVVAAEEAQRLRPAVPEGVDLQLEVAPDLPPVAVNEPQLRTVLAQLLDNAREALAGPGVIRLSARPAFLDETQCGDLMGDPTPGPCVEVVIADTGCGLAPAVRRRLFQQPFLSTKPRHRGLGLAVVYGILHAHRGGFRLEEAGTPAGEQRTGNGEPGVESEEDAPLLAPVRGTVVRLYLPLAGAPVSLPVEMAAPSAREKVLVVDDDPAILQLIGTTLESAGYQVQLFNCPVQALDSYAKGGVEPFQLVLSDVVMPQMNGFDMARRLLHHDARARVMFMSGYASPEMARTHGVHWQYDLLSKPFRPDALLRAVRSALDRGPSRTPTADGGMREENVVSFP